MLRAVCKLAQRRGRRVTRQLNINQAIADYKRLGYSDKWINNRIKGIEVRKGLTDEWERAGVQSGQQFAVSWKAKPVNQPFHQQKH